MRDILTNLNKFGMFNRVIGTFKEDCGVKLTVNLTLMYKTIDNLGTEEHIEFKRKLETGEDVGCFALTELAHGSNVRGILTTAIYDNESREFIINSPTKEAMKFWIGGAAKTANVCVAFAQLIINGEH